MLSQILIILFYFNGAQGDQVASDAMTLTVGVGGASKTGFSWTYHMENPDIDSQPGSIYWVLTPDGVTRTIDAVMSCTDPLTKDDGVTKCCGSTVQTDGDIHQQTMECETLTPETTYLFWVVADHDSTGLAAVYADSTGTQVPVAADKDCSGFWSVCDTNCIEEYTILQYPEGDGAGCVFGDEEERTCAPGTGDCPIQGTAVLHDETPDGFKLDLTSDTAIEPGAKWYYIVTPPGATPTAAEVVAEQGGLCGGTVDIVDTSTITEDVLCQLDEGTYSVWAAEDPNGDGVATLVPEMTANIPASAPIGDFYAHTPTETGYVLSYTVTHPNANGKFYYRTYPSGSPTPSLEDIRADDPCGGSEQQTVPSGLKTITVSCALTPGETYDIYGEVDIDGLGGSASMTNMGVHMSLTVPADTTTTAGAATTTTTAAATTTADSGSGSTAAATTTTSGTTQAPVTTKQALGTFRVIYPGQECETDNVAGVNHMWDTILLPFVGVGLGSVATCAGHVSQNRANNGGCSTLFHTGGLTGECRCVRLGYVCDRDESETGKSIFQLCLSSQHCNMMITYFPDVLAKTQEHAKTAEALPQPPSAETEEPSRRFPVMTLTLAAFVGVVVGILAYLAFIPRKPALQDEYHISLDAETRNI